MANFNPPAPCGAGRWSGTTFSVGHTISIHPPHAGRDVIVSILASLQSISIHPPHAGRDVGTNWRRRTRRNFNPPAPCGAGQEQRIYQDGGHHFNPPAPCGAGLPQVVALQPESAFQSTRPMRGGTRPAGEIRGHVDDFNPPAPCGAGRSLRRTKGRNDGFQSTRPMRGGTPDAQHA